MNFLFETAPFRPTIKIDRGVFDKRDTEYYGCRTYTIIK